MSEKTLVKAKNYLSEGKVLVVLANKKEAFFAVQGSDSEPYSVRAYAAAWQCSCPAQVECAHIQACKLIYQLPNTALRISQDSEFDSLFRKIDPQVENEYYT